METKKISTYIEGLDEVLGGVFPVGHVVLVSGLPGTMKSTLSYAILHGNALQRGAKCLYVSLEQTRKSLEDQMAAMGFDVEAVRGDVHILDVGTIQKEIGRSATKPWMEFLRDLGPTTFVLAEAASEAPFLGLEPPQPRRDETFLADGILELKMHQITDVEVQRRIRVSKMRGSHHMTGFSALVFEGGRFQITSIMSL